jgi:hypothetical protein
MALNCSLFGICLIHMIYTMLLFMIRSLINSFLSPLANFETQSLWKFRILSPNHTELMGASILVLCLKKYRVVISVSKISKSQSDICCRNSRPHPPSRWHTHRPRHKIFSLSYIIYYVPHKITIFPSSETDNRSICQKRNRK